MMSKKKNKTQWKKNNWDIVYAQYGVEALKALGIYLEGNSKSYYIPNGQQCVQIAKREASRMMQTYFVLHEGISREEAQTMAPEDCNYFDRMFPKPSQRYDKQTLRTCPRLWGIVHPIVRRRYKEIVV